MIRLGQPSNKELGWGDTHARIQHKRLKCDFMITEQLGQFEDKIHVAQNR